MAESQAVIRLNATDDGATSTIQRVGAASDAAAGSSDNLKKQLRELQKELATLDPNSQKFQELSLRAGQVKDQINDAAEAVRANAGSAFEGLSNNAGLLTDRLLNLDFEGVASAAKGLGANIGRIDLKSLTAGIAQAGSAFASLGRALLTNPIFLLGAAVAALVVYWDDLTASLQEHNYEAERQAQLAKDMTSEMQSQSKGLATQIVQINALFDAISDQNLAEEERQQALRDLQTLYPQVFANQDIDINNTNALTQAKQNLIAAITAEAKANAARGLLEKKYAEQLDLELQIKQKELELSKTIVSDTDKILNATGLSVFQKLTGGTNAQQEYEKSLQTLTDSKNQIELNNKTILELEQMVGDAVLETAHTQAETTRNTNKNRVTDNRHTNNKISDDNKRAQEKAEEDAKRAEEKLNAEIAAIQEEQRLAKLSKDEVELINSQKKFDALAAQANGNAEALAQIEELRIAEEESIRTRQFEERQAQEQALEEQRIKTIEENAAKEAEIKKKADEEEIARIKEVNAAKIEAQQTLEDTKLAIASDAIELAKAVAGKSEKAANALFLVEKALAIANVIVSTQREIAGYYSNPTWSLLPDGGLAIKSAMATSAKIRAGLSIATIVATSISKFKGGSASTPSTGGGGGGGGSMGMSLATAAGGGGGGGVAQFNPLNTNFVNNRPGQVSQTYVLAGDVANAQEARNRVQDLARL